MLSNTVLQNRAMSTRAEKVGRLFGTTGSGRHPLNIQGTGTPGGTSGAPAVTLLNLRKGSISGMRVSRVTRARKTKLKLKLRSLSAVTRIKTVMVREMLKEWRRYST